MAMLLYGSGLRVLEMLRLQVKDVDFGYSQITVWDGKGGAAPPRASRPGWCKWARGAPSMEVLLNIREAVIAVDPAATA